MNAIRRTREALKRRKKAITEKKANLVEQEIGEELLCGEEMGAARAIALVAEVSDDAHVAEAVPARRQERVPDRLHANRAEEILVHLHLRRRRAYSAAERILRLRLYRRAAEDGGRRPHLRLHRRDQSAARTLVHRNSSLFLSLTFSL